MILLGITITSANIYNLDTNFRLIMLIRQSFRDKNVFHVCNYFILIFRWNHVSGPLIILMI